MNVPDSDLMATNGVVHVVKNVLYPAGEKSRHHYIFMQCPLRGGMHYGILMMYMTYRPSCGPRGPPGPPEEAD